MSSDDDLKAVGRFLKRLRVARRLPQVRLGAATGFSAASISNVELGKFSPDSTALLAMFAFFGRMENGPNANGLDGCDCTLRAHWMNNYCELNLLEAKGIVTIRDAAKKTRSELLAFFGVGSKTADEVARILALHGMNLTSDTPLFDGLD
jgi:hypothetical protein